MKFIETWATGQVIRKHTMENIRAENVAEHTWGLVTLLLMCWPNAPGRVIICAQIHDCGEKTVGDVPGPTKWANPVLSREIERLEEEDLKRVMPKHFLDAMAEMNNADWAVVEFFDRIEFCVSMARERRLGNTYSMFYFGRSLRKAESTIDEHAADIEAKDPLLYLNMKLLLREIKEEQHNLEVM